MAYNYCKYCNKYFHFKDLFDQHVVTCEYFYRSKRQKERELDSIEILPSGQEQFKLIQHMFVKMKSLENEVMKLRIENGVRKRKYILELLNQNEYSKPPLSFEQWYKTLVIQEKHLKRIFDGDVCDGIKSLLNDYITFNNIPICSFKQKQNTIYIYTNEESPKWIILQHDVFDIWYRHMNHLFLQAFLQWQMDNSDLIQSSEEERDKNISNVHKINGLSDNYEQKRKQGLKKWIYDKIAKDISMSEFVYS